MDLTFSAEHTRFREEVRQWLDENRPGEQRPQGLAECRDFDKAWQRRLFDAGWACVAWPKEHGGRGLSLVERLIWYEEYANARAPWAGCMWVGINHAGPILMGKGTDSQKSFYLPRILRGEDVWCQGFSEPGSGSDLASLQTRGDIDGDHLVVNGTKIWTSFSPIANLQELLVRTDRTAPKHKGISWVITDMQSPGITIRPISTMAGHSHFAQIYYDDVRIPLENLVGGLNNGWAVAQSTLGFERGLGFIPEQIDLGHQVEALIDLARTALGPDGVRPAIQDDEIASRLAVLRAEVRALRAMTYGAASRSMAGNPPGAEASITRLFFAELNQRTQRLALDILGTDALELDAAGGWPERYLNMFRHTIAAGTSEIQRNIIGERVLGLPREA